MPSIRAAVSWPKAYGGREASLFEWLIFEEEYYRVGAPSRVTQNGIFLLAPIITFTVALAAWAVIPFDRGWVLTDVNAGLLYVLALTALALVLTARQRIPALAAAAAETISPFSVVEISSRASKSLAAWATAETYWPWFFQDGLPPRGPTEGTVWSRVQPFSGFTSSSAGVSGQRSHSAYAGYCRRVSRVRGLDVV